MGHRIATPVSLVAGLALLASACAGIDEERAPEPLDPPGPGCLQLSTADVSFDDVRVPPGGAGPALYTLQLSNGCDGPVQLSNLTIAGDSPEGTFTIGALSRAAIEPDGSALLNLAFSPTGGGTWTDRLLIDSDTPDRPRMEVSLSGFGIAPMVVVTPAEVAFDAPLIGCETTTEVVIENVGEEGLIIEDITLATAAPNQFHLDLRQPQNGSFPYEISHRGIDRNVRVSLSYRPLDSVPDRARLVLTTNDPARPYAYARATGSGTFLGETSVTFPGQIPGPVDLLFTVDRTPNMSQELLRVPGAIRGLVGELNTLGVDYHLTAIVEEDGCPLGPVTTIDRSFSVDEAVAAFIDMLHLEDRETSAYDERQMMQMEAALTAENIGPGGCNAEWYRPHATLHLIGITNEPDQSLNSWGWYVAILTRLKEDPADVTLHAIGGVHPPECERAATAAALMDAVDATGGRFLSVCALDWADHGRRLAQASAAGHKAYTLGQRPVPETVTIRIDGEVLEQGWTYDPARNAIGFELDHVPRPTSTVEASYHLQPQCP